MPTNTANAHPGIKVHLLPDDIRKHYNTGTETEIVNAETVYEYLSTRLAGKTFAEPNWPRAIDAEKLEPEVKVNGKIVYAARTTQGARAIYVTHKTPKPSEEEWIIALAILPQHGYEKCPILSNAAPQLASDIADAIAILEAEAPKIDNAIDKPHPTISPKKQTQLTATQKRILEKMGEHSSGLVFSPGGVGKTTLLVAWLKAKIDSEQVARCFVTTPDVKQLVLASLGAALNHPLLTVQTWDEFRAEQKSYSLEFSTGDKKPLVYFEESENTAQKTPCFLTWFEQQFPLQKKTSGKKKNSGVPHHDPEILWAEFTRVIFQLSDPYSSDEYHALGERESHYKKEERTAIYTAFTSYLTYARNVPTHYERHENDHQILLSMTPAEIHALGIDEVQAAPTTLAKAALKLTRPHTQLLWVGDAEQDTGLSKRTRKPLEDALKEQKIPYHSFQLAANLRSAKKPINAANLLLYLKNVLLGSKERDTTFFLDNSEATKEGAFFYMPDVSPRFSNNVKSDARFAVLIPDETTDSQLEKLKETWGNHLFRVSDSRGLEWDHVILTGFSDEILKPLEEAILAHQTLRNGFLPLPKELVFGRKQSDDTPEKSAQIEKVLSQLYTAVTRAKENIYFCGTDSSLFQGIETHLYPKKSAAAEDRDEAVAQVIFQRSTPRDWFNTAKNYVEKQMATKGFGILWTTDVWGTIEHAAAAKKLVVGLKADVIIAQVDLALSTDNPIQTLRTLVKAIKEPATNPVETPPAAKAITHKEAIPAPAAQPKNEAENDAVTLTQPIPHVIKSNLTETQETALKKVQIELDRKNPSIAATKAALLSKDLWQNNQEILACIQSLLFPEDHKKTMKYCEEMLTFAKTILKKDLITVTYFYHFKKNNCTKKESSNKVVFAEKIRKELTDPETIKTSLKKSIARFQELLKEGTEAELINQHYFMLAVFKLYDVADIQAVFFSPDTTIENSILLQLIQKFIAHNPSEMNKKTFFLLTLKGAIKSAPDNITINTSFHITLIENILRYIATQDDIFSLIIETLLDQSIFAVTDDFFSAEPSLQQNLLSAVTSVYFRFHEMEFNLNNKTENLKKLFFDLINRLDHSILEKVFLQSESESESVISKLTHIFVKNVNTIEAEYKKLNSPTQHTVTFLEAAKNPITKNAEILFTLSEIITHLRASPRKDSALKTLACALPHAVHQLFSLYLHFEDSSAGRSTFNALFVPYKHSLELLCQECKKADITSQIGFKIYRWFHFIQKATQIELTDAISCALSIAHIIPNFTNQFLSYLEKTPRSLCQFSIILGSISTPEISLASEKFYESGDAHPPIYALCFTAQRVDNENVSVPLFIMAAVLSSLFAAITHAKNKGDQINFEKWIKNLIQFYDCLPPHLVEMATRVNTAINQKKLITLFPTGMQLTNPLLYNIIIENSFSGISLASLIGMTFDALSQQTPQIAYGLSRFLKDSIGNRMHFYFVQALSSPSLHFPTISNDTASRYTDRLKAISDPNSAQSLCNALASLRSLYTLFSHHFSEDTIFFKWISSLDICCLQIERIIQEEEIAREITNGNEHPPVLSRSPLMLDQPFTSQQVTDKSTNEFEQIIKIKLRKSFSDPKSIEKELESRVKELIVMLQNHPLFRENPNTQLTLLESIVRDILTQYQNGQLGEKILKKGFFNLDYPYAKALEDIKSKVLEILKGHEVGILERDNIASAEYILGVKKTTADKTPFSLSHPSFVVHRDHFALRMKR